MTTHVNITRRATFAAAHILCRDDWSEEKNREVFGACVTDHGHNYVIEVTVGGPLDAATGMVVNLKHVDSVLRREFIDAVDHRHLNRDVDFMQEVYETMFDMSSRNQKIYIQKVRRVKPPILPQAPLIRWGVRA